MKLFKKWPEWLRYLGIVLLILLPFSTIFLMLYALYRNRRQKMIDSFYLTTKAFRDKDFENEVTAAAEAVGVSVNELLSVFWHESRLDPEITNSIGARGLFQMLPSTQRMLGVEGKALTASQQARLFPVYFYRSTGKKKVPFSINRRKLDLYLAVFFPAAVGKPFEYVLQAGSLTASAIARNNQGFDLNKNGIITVGEINEYIKKNFR